MIRQKKKPDTIKVNYVRSVPGKRSVRIEPKSYPISHLNPSKFPAPPADQLQWDADVVDDPSGHTSDIGDFGSSDHGQPGSHRARKEKAAEAWSGIR